MIDSHSFILYADDNSPGDTTWRSGWVWACTILAKRGGRLYDLATWFGIESDELLRHCKHFMGAFQKHCMKDERLLVHPNNKEQPFSRDQLLPLLFYLAVAHSEFPDARPMGKKIIQKICDLDDEHENLAGGHKRGEVNASNRSIIGMIAKLYGAKYHDTSLTAWLGALAIYEGAYKYAPSYARSLLPACYSMWNNVAALGAVAAVKGLSNQNVKDARKYFDWFAAEGWGPGYRLARGQKVEKKEIDAYKNLTRWTNDMLHQRGGKDIKPGKVRLLDWPVLIGLDCLFS